MGEPSARGDSSQTGDPAGRTRPVEVTVISWIFIAGSALGLVLLVVLQVRGARLSIPGNLGAVVGIAVHFISGILMLRGWQSGRVVFWLGAPILIPILAALRSFDWFILVCIGTMGILVGFLDTPATERFFFGELAEMGRRSRRQAPQAGK